MDTLTNTEATLCIEDCSAQITSFKDNATQMEAMWCGDPKFWSGKNPILFPMVGSTWDKVLHINGKDYTMGNHGFCRHMDFATVEKTATSITKQLCAKEETLAQYPFDFKLTVKYELEGKKVSITYLIENNSDTVMPFNFGLHPAFNCPMIPGTQFSDYWLAFDQPETINGETVTKLPLSYELFEQVHTLLLENPKSRTVTLTNGTHGVHLDVKGYRWLAFWTKETGAPFVCLEPWHSHGDFEKVEVPFEKREGTILLEPHQTYTTSTAIVIF